MCNFTFFIHPASFTLVCYDKVLKSKEVEWIQDNWSIFETSSTKKNWHTAICDMMKKLYSLLLILALINKVHAFQKFMSVLITFAAINYEEMLKKDFALKYFLEVNVEQTPCQWLIICCWVYFLSLLSFTNESVDWNRRILQRNS